MLRKKMLRRLKNGLLRRRLFVYIFGVCILGLVAYFCRSHFACLDAIIDFKVQKECTRYFRNEITGNYCPEMCAGDGITSFTCLAGSSTKWLGNKSGKNLVLSKAKSDDTYETLTWMDREGALHHPNAEEFNNLIRRLVLFNFNKSVPHDQLTNMLQLKSENNQVLFRASQISAWNLIQDSDFLVASLFEDKELFPKVYGSCGTIYFTEYLGQPVRVERGAELTLAGWKMNVKMAVLIMDFIEELEQAKLVMCDIDTGQFGIVDNRMKYGDMTIIFSPYFINRMLRNAKPCINDDDCSYKGCKSACHKHAKICSERQLNSNLQLVCDKVFKGTPSEPGILSWNRTPKALRNMIERCANPQLPKDVDQHRRLAPSTELRNLIYNELANIYETLGMYAIPFILLQTLSFPPFYRKRSVHFGLTCK